MELIYTIVVWTGFIFTAFYVGIVFLTIALVMFGTSVNGLRYMKEGKKLYLQLFSFTIRIAIFWYLYHTHLLYDIIKLIYEH